MPTGELLNLAYFVLVLGYCFLFVVGKFNLADSILTIMPLFNVTLIRL